MNIPQVALASVILSLLTACGGGGGDGSPSVSGEIGGTATKGPVKNATVAAFGISGGHAGAQIATATTDASGNFMLSIGSYSGPVMLQASGGTYADEARGISMTMASGDMLTAVMPSIAAGTTNNGVQLTPVTAMAQAMADHMAGGMTDANIRASNTAMGNYFSIGDILHVRPMNPLVTGSGAGAAMDARNYGMTLAAMSQYAKSLNMAVSSAMATAMMTDASDGIMNGKNDAGQISMTMGGMMGGSMMPTDAGTSGLAAAMSSFIVSAANTSGVTEADMATLVQKLTHSNGRIQ